jgi:hypothetical protein
MLRAEPNDRAAAGWARTIARRSPAVADQATRLPRRDDKAALRGFRDGDVDF